MSSKLGKRWRIDGIDAAFIMRGRANGHYKITFEKSVSTLDQIESINWAAPSIQKLSGSDGELSLPEGYGFELVDITYSHASQIFVVEVNTAKQYLGDVTGYQSEIETLSATVKEQAATIQTLQEAGTAADLETELDAAYKEGVNSVE